jgi:hypothetical protein
MWEEVVHDWARSTLVFVRPGNPNKPPAHHQFCALLQGMCIDANLFGRYGQYFWLRGNLTILKRRKGMTL